MYIQAKDISKWQGDWQDTGESIVMIKVSGGDNGLYYDPKATQNYYGSKNAGKAIGMYHFAGGTDAIAEANFFIKACSPLEENDVLALDWEVGNADPVGWCTQFVNRVHDATGVWPLLYLNLSTLNAHDWSPVLASCGLWLADWSVSPDGEAPTHHTYVMQQYGDSPYDKDAWFGTIDQFKAYGYHTLPVEQPPVNVTIPIESVEQPISPVSQPEPVVEPVVNTPVDTPIEVSPIIVETPQKHWYDFLLTFVSWFFK